MFSLCLITAYILFELFLWRGVFLMADDGRDE